ncbi:MFS transporter [Sulfolobus sp. E5-1-F]|uniref:MFS transporter n=1 Tax=Saccharolobus sp. E5-1-F TaxID=2663019 RepID=UPI001295255F|nr:MFS transporter [Sulfolobus sp. E5-1-F]QGA54008.1 MFS transporter [Sulfolobus sp. E5-1-F]
MAKDTSISGEGEIEVSPKEVRNVFLISSIGNLIDYYDFFVADIAAALVWPSLFISPVVSNNPNLALAISLATYGIAFLARPLGAFIFGHLGDKIGRQSTLVLTLLLSFIGVLGIALLPPIGLAAVILLFVLRFIVGLGFGGEWGGGATWYSEFAYKMGSLGTYSALYNIMGQMGIVAASLGFTALSLLLPEPAIVSWGWRLLFYIAAIVLVAGAIVRYLFRESPVFLKLKKKAQVARYPAAEVLRRYGGKVLLLAGSWFYITAIMSGITVAFSVSYIVTLAKGGLIGGLPSPAVASLGGAIGFIVALWTATLAAGILLDKKKIRSPKVVFYISTTASAIAVPIFFILANTLSLPLIMIAYIILVTATVPSTAVQAYWYTKEFETKYRVSGAGLAYQFGGLFSGIYTTFVLPPIIALAPSILQSWPYVAASAAAVSMISLICTILVKETKGDDKELYER